MDTLKFLDKVEEEISKLVDGEFTLTDICIETALVEKPDMYNEYRVAVSDGTYKLVVTMKKNTLEAEDGR